MLFWSHLATAEKKDHFPLTNRRWRCISYWLEAADAGKVPWLESRDASPSFLPCWYCFSKAHDDHNTTWSKPSKAARSLSTKETVGRRLGVHRAPGAQHGGQTQNRERIQCYPQGPWTEGYQSSLCYSWFLLWFMGNSRVELLSHHKALRIPRSGAGATNAGSDGAKVSLEFLGLAGCVETQ